MTDALELKRRIQSARRKGMFPKSLKRDVGAFVKAEREAGQKLKHLSKLLTASSSTLSRWQSEAALSVESEGKLVPVRVEVIGPEPKRQRGTQVVTMVSPAGWRIEDVPFELAWQVLSSDNR